MAKPNPDISPEEPDLDALLASLSMPEPGDAEEPDLDALLASLNEPDATVAEPDATVAEPEHAVAEPPCPPPAAVPAAVTPAPERAPVAAAPLPPPPRPKRNVRTPPIPITPPDDLDEEEQTRWAALDGLIQTSWQAADVDESTFWFTLEGRQGPPVILVGASDTEANRKIAWPDGDPRRSLSTSGGGKFYRFVDRGLVKLMLTSGLGSADARSRVTQELERLAYFPGLTVKF